MLKNVKVFKFVLSTLLAFCSVEGFSNSNETRTLPPLPNPAPLRPIATSGERIAPRLNHENHSTKKGEGFAVPYFQAGNKTLYVRRGGSPLGETRPDTKRNLSGALNPKFFIGDHLLASFSFWGGNKNGSGGYPFKELEDSPDRVVFDENKNLYTCTRTYISKDGGRAEFVLTMRTLPDGKLEMAWDTGSEEGVDLWIVFSQFRGKSLSFGGVAFSQSSKNDLLSGRDGAIDTVVKGSLNFDGGNPVGSFRILFEDESASGKLTESCKSSKRGDKFGLIYRSLKLGKNSKKSSGKIILDFGECAVAKNARALSGTIDFWECDATDVPLAATRNLIPNPSFEQGLRYWRVRGEGNDLDIDQLPAFEIVKGGIFGDNAAVLRKHSQYLFPLSLKPDKKYVLSLYAKAIDKNANLRVPVQNAGTGGNYPGKWGFGDFSNKECQFKLSSEWKRFSRVIKGDAAGARILLQGKNVMLDGLQLEESESGEPTDFVAPALEGNFLTSGAPLNDVSFGEPINARLEIIGKSGETGNVKISIKNIFYENLFEKDFSVKLDKSGKATLNIPLDEKKLGCGVFVVRADYALAGQPAYTDYYRFSVMKKLSNTHPTKDIFGTGFGFTQHADRDAAARKFMEWGFGSTTWYKPIRSPKMQQELEKTKGVTALFKKYKTSNNIIAVSAVTDEMVKLGGLREWKKNLSSDKNQRLQITEQMEKIIEENAYQLVKNTPPEVMECVAFGNEEESLTAGIYDEYAKAQLAVYRGAKRANPNVKVAPTHGTSGYSKSRGRDAIDGYLQAAKKRGIYYDAVGVHPYWNYDYDPNWDFDENITYLRSRLRHYGYPDTTTMYMSECGNMCDAEIPQWGTYWYDNYKGGKASYDFGNQEIFQACLYARNYIAALKFYPQLRSVNVWTPQPYIDYNFAPLLLCKTVNTLGNLYPDVEFVDDIRPSAKIRGYSFKLKDGSGKGIAAIWSSDLSVVKGQRACPKIRVKFGQPVEFFDFDGNPRSARVDADGFTLIPITFAPLSIKASDVKKLTQALQNAEVEDSSNDIQVLFQPTVSGGVNAAVSNFTGRKLGGKILIGKNEYPYSIAGKSTENILLADSSQGTDFCKLYKWADNFRIIPDKGEKIEGVWDMQYFYIPRVEGTPHWDKIPSLPMNNKMLRKPIKSGSDSPDDVSGTYKLAWDSQNLYLRVEIKDNQFVTFPDEWKNPASKKALYIFDGAINVYFDCAADARSKVTSARASGTGQNASEGQYDTNDYVYHFAPTADGSDGAGSVWRWLEVDQQLADGVNMPKKEEASEKIKCDFKRTSDGYIYTITFANRYIEPILLKEGSIAGFGICLHDRDKNSNGAVVYKSISNSSKNGVHTDSNPHLYPLMILK